MCWESEFAKIFLSMIDPILQKTRDHMKKAIREPDSSNSAFGGRTVSRKMVEGKLLEVVYTRGGRNEYRIITAYYILNE